MRYICGGDLHPDHDTICAFRLKNREAFKEVFTKVLLLGVELGHLKKIGGISIDGTKIKANASKHAAVSYKRAGEMIAQLEQEIEELVRKAEDADSAPLDDGLVLPDEIKRREDRKAALERACRTMEERYEETRREKEREYAAKKAKRETERQAGKKPRGKDPQPPSETPPDDMQYNFTDEESRIMKAGNGKHYEQAYNAQAAVDTEGSMLIVGQYVTAHANDKQELPVAAASVDPAIREVDTVCADTGYFCEKAVLEVEDDDGPMVYCAVEKQSHHRTVEDLLKKAEPVPPPDDAPVKEKMAFRLKTQAGRTVYKKRKETVEPVFGIIKTILGFRGFLLRGLDKVSIEWDLITAAYNFKRLHKHTISNDFTNFAEGICLNSRKSFHREVKMMIAGGFTCQRYGFNVGADKFSLLTIENGKNKHYASIGMDIDFPKPKISLRQAAGIMNLLDRKVF